jgi:hypothetical protein
MPDSNLVPKVPEQNAGQSQLWLPRVINPLAGIWWASQSISDVPENIMGWLVAQGFEVTGIRQDNTTVPPTNYFSVTKEGLTPQSVLTDLCNSYTIAANDARTANQVRYNEILVNMAQMIDSSHTQFDAQVDEQNYQSGVFLTDLDQYMTNIEALITENRSQVVTDAEDAKVALDEMLARVGDLETNATDNASVINTLLATQDTNVNDFINDFDSRLVELDQNFAAYLGSVLSQIAALGTVLDTHVADYNQHFVVLANNYSTHATDIESQLASIEPNVQTYVNAVADVLTLLESDYLAVEIDLNALKTDAGDLATQFAGDYDAILARLESDYAVHAGTAQLFLTDLGQTELARINEQFNASLSAQMQMLVSKGLSMSTLPVDFTARNTRDRDENIQALNDRLNREKLDNEHKLYEQQVAMRSRMMDGTDRMHAVQQEVLRYRASLVSSIFGLLNDARNRILAGKQAIFAANDANLKYGIEISSNLYAKLQDVKQRTIDSLDRIYQLRDVFAKWEEGETVKRYEQLQQIESQFLESIQRQFAAKQDATKTKISQKDTLLQQLQSALTALMSGKERYAVLLMQNANTLAEHKHRAIVEMMNVSIQRLDGWKDVADQERKLMVYQLDERNKMLMAVYAFVERREDIAPEWRDMAKMIAGLGDSGGGWLQP